MVTLFWFRRDLRLNDNAGLFHALKNNQHVIPIFIFDTDILSKLHDKNDKRIHFIHQELSELNVELKKYESSLQVYFDKPLEVFKMLLNKYKTIRVYTNNDYEPYAIKRDTAISNLLKANNSSFYSFKDIVIFEKNEIVKENNSPYLVFTPYSNKWKSLVNKESFVPFENKKYFINFSKIEFREILSLHELGFNKVQITYPSKNTKLTLIKDYEKWRDFPGKDSTSKLGLHLRFGTISIRKLARVGFELSEKWLNELIWREFYMSILYHFPTPEKSFKPKYDLIEWNNNEQEFNAWCNGMTGYPIVDAGMRELNATGFMHNRVRMIVASFLIKHLLIDWRWGEAYFAEKLLDYELASNNGGWQWVAGSGCDGAPYFRIFNPESQTKKFDPQNTYIKKWIPELNSNAYPKPIIEHRFARERCLSVFKMAFEN